jgi:uncharacterized protein (TIGR03083 family)
MMQVSQYVAELERAGLRLSHVVAVLDLDDPVPTCPNWVVRDLIHHLGGVHRWATSFVESRRSEPTTPDEDAMFFVTVPDADLLSWFQEGHLALVTTLSKADPELQCWTFLPASSPLAFWARRQAHETTIHCADAEACGEWTSDVSSEFAVDGIDELLNGFFARARSRLVADPPVTLAIAPTDVDASWTIRIESERRLVSPGVSHADCFVTGTSGDLYRLLWNRAKLSTVDIRGDISVMNRWREHATVSWS